MAINIPLRGMLISAFLSNAGICLICLYAAIESFETC
ncbi:Uncharacterised protein [Serratia liquefaciens]|nr:Uncharacterised protein [Serratia liquefaciens]